MMKLSLFLLLLVTASVLGCGKPDNRIRCPQCNAVIVSFDDGCSSCNWVHPPHD